MSGAIPLTSGVGRANVDGPRALWWLQVDALATELAVDLRAEVSLACIAATDCGTSKAGS